LIGIYEFTLISFYFFEKQILAIIRLQRILLQLMEEIGNYLQLFAAKK